MIQCIKHLPCMVVWRICVPHGSRIWILGPQLGGVQCWGDDGTLGDRGSLEQMSGGWTFASTFRSPSLLVFVVEAVLSQLLAPPCHYRLSFTLKFSVTPSFYRLLIVMIFHHSNRKVTHTPCKCEDLMSSNAQNTHKARYGSVHLKTDTTVCV